MNQPRERRDATPPESQSQLNAMSRDELQSLVVDLQARLTAFEQQNQELHETMTELRRSHDRRAGLIELPLVGCLTLDRSGVVCEANLAAADLLGLQRTQLIGRRILEFLQEDAREVWERRQQDLFSQHQRQDGSAPRGGQRSELSAKDANSHVCEVGVRRPDGKPMTVQFVSCVADDKKNGSETCRTALIDVTEKKLAEDALRQLNIDLGQSLAHCSQELQETVGQIRLLSLAIAHLGEGVLITDDDLDWPGPRIVFVNEALCRITGYANEELIGKSPRILQGEDTDRETLDWIRVELAAGRSCTAEVVNYRKDGQRYDAELFITPVFNAEGARTNFVAIHRDVSARKRAEAELRNSEERIRAILNAAADSILTIDQSGVITGFNPATENMFGYEKQELIGQNVSILMPESFSKEQDEYLARYLETGEARIIGIGREVAACRKDGSLFPVELSISQVDHLGLFVGIVRDLNEKKKAEDLARREQAFSQNVVNTARTAVLVLDNDGCIVQFNAYLEELTGWREEEVRGREWFQMFIPERDRKRIRRLFEKAIGGRRTRGFVNAIVAKDGEERELQWYDAPLTDAGGRQIGLLCTGLDVTEQRMLERQILEVAAEEDRRIGQELHDSIQQQLTGLGLLARNLADRLGEQSISDAALADRLARGVNETGRQVHLLSRGLVPVEVDAQGLQTALENLAATIDEQYPVACELITEGPVEVADNFVATNLFRIAQEAVNNAVKHSRCDVIKISLRGDQDAISLEVKDNGVGLARAREAAQGMGLRIMQYRAGLFGGALTLESTPNGGVKLRCKFLRENIREGIVKSDTERTARTGE